MKVAKCREGLAGELSVPGDKSISHRAVMLGALAEGITDIKGFLPGEDCLATIDCFRKLGVRIEQDKSMVRVYGAGLYGLKPFDGELYVGNSGTTIRLMLGILAGQPFKTTVTGDASIQRRPMRRVVEPLSLMGARIEGRQDNNFAPLTINPTEGLQAIEYHLPVASAQVKSAILLAGLYARGKTTVVEPSPSRDHTEIMLRFFGAGIERRGKEVTITPGAALKGGRNIKVPGDISSAAFLLTAALIVPHSDVTVRGVGINPTRTGIIDVFRAMGADIEVTKVDAQSGEEIADIRVRYSELNGTEVKGELIPRLIDEIPAIAVAAACARGETVIRDAAELKVKESNRIAAIAQGLAKMGIEVQELPDGMIIKGGRLTEAEIDSGGDHRIAMAFAVAGLAAEGSTVIGDDACIPVSFPGFARSLKSLGATVTD